MKKLFIIALISSLAFVPSGFHMRKMDYRLARNINVCKSLKDNALLYFVFVDTKETKPWTQYDIQSTIDSIRVAINWLHIQARENNITLNIIADYHIGDEYTTITRNLPGGNIINSVNEPNLAKGIEAMNRWADGVAKIAGSTLPLSETDGIPEISNPRNKERLVAYLRDQNSVESVAVLFLINNYFQTDISLPLNTTNTDDVEFAVVSYKYPSEIAHNFLHLYGAADMHKTIYRRSESKIEQLNRLFPDEVMQNPYGKNIWKLEISEYTRYLIGWSDRMNPEYESLMIDKAMKF